MWSGLGQVLLSQRKEFERIIWTLSRVSSSFLLTSFCHNAPLSASCSYWPGTEDSAKYWSKELPVSDW